MWHALLPGSRRLDVRASAPATPTKATIGILQAGARAVPSGCAPRGRKNAVRTLLARGMRLGAAAPISKLLHKVEADSVPLWQARYFDAMVLR